MGLEWTNNCDQTCRYRYRGRCVHDEPTIYLQARTALCIEKAGALIAQAEAIATEAWQTWQSDYARETERLALLADEERQGSIDWTTIAALLFLAGFWAAAVTMVVRLWR